METNPNSVIICGKCGGAMSDEGIEMSAGKERCLGMPVALIGGNNPNVIGLFNARTTAMVITTGILIQRIQGRMVIAAVIPTSKLNCQTQIPKRRW